MVLEEGRVTVFVPGGRTIGAISTHSAVTLANFLLVCVSQGGLQDQKDSLSHVPL